jgi:hypothetical protein
MWTIVEPRFNRFSCRRSSRFWRRSSWRCRRFRSFNKLGLVIGVWCRPFLSVGVSDREIEGIESDLPIVGEKGQRRYSRWVEPDAITENEWSAGNSALTGSVTFKQNHDFMMASRAFGFCIGAPLWFDPVGISGVILKSQASEPVTLDLCEITKNVVWLVTETVAKNVAKPWMQDTLNLKERVRGIFLCLRNSVLLFTSDFC